MKKTVKLFVITLVACIVVFCFVGPSYTRISDIDIVSGIAIDKEGETWVVTCEICVPSGQEDFASKTKYVKGKGYTLENALDNASLLSSNRLYTDSVQLYIVTEAARNEKCLLQYFKGANSNLRAVAIFAKGTASEMLKSDEKSGERAKSLSLAKKIKSFCKDNEIAIPRLIELIKNEDKVIVSYTNTLERKNDD